MVLLVIFVHFPITYTKELPIFTSQTELIKKENPDRIRFSPGNT